MLLAYMYQKSVFTRKKLQIAEELRIEKGPA